MYAPSKNYSDTPHSLRRRDIRRFFRAGYGRWWKLSSLLLVAAACAACLPPSPEPTSQPGLPRGIVYVHNPDPYVEQAMAWWNGLAGHTLFADAQDNDWSGVWVYHAGYTNCPGEGVRACTSVADANGVEQSPGLFPYRWCDVLLHPEETAWNVIAHELGHCLGFGHVTDRPSIMGPSSADPNGWQQDQAMLRAAGY